MFLTLLFFSTFCFGLEPERKFSEDELFAGAAKLKQYLSTAKAVKFFSLLVFLVWFGLVWFGLVWFGSVWFWFGLVWFWFGFC